VGHQGAVFEEANTQVGRYGIDVGIAHVGRSFLGHRRAGNYPVLL
jgi:hypothetical protein